MLKVGTRLSAAWALFFTLALSAQSAGAAGVSASTVQIGGVAAALLLPSHPRGGLVLLAGGDGNIGVGADGAIAREGNQLVRTRAAYAARGFAVLVPDCCVDVAAAVQFMEKFGPVTLVGTSRGTQRAAHGIAAGARPARLVLTSGFLSDASGDSDNAVRILGSPDALPPTLVVEHRHDECRKTAPEGVKPFVDWAGGKARAVWLDGGASEGAPCEAFAHHGFNGIDGQVVSVVSSFAAR
jgi:hypothetical protein